MSVRFVTRKRGDRTQEYWLVDVEYRRPDGTTQRVKRVPRVQTRRGAEQYEREVLASLANGTFNQKPSKKEEKPKVLFADFAKRFLEHYVAANNKLSEAETKESVFRVHLIPFFGTMSLESINEERVDRYKTSKLKDKVRPLGPKTINNHLTILRKTLAIAVKWHELSHVPEIQWLKTPEPEVEFFDFDEADRLFAGAAPEWRAMITVAARTGMRIGELLGLRWDDVDLKAEHLRVRRAVARGKIGTPKSGKGRKIPLSRDALEALRSHRHLRGELVFCAESGRMLTRTECKWPLWSACKRAGLRKVGWHVLRHTFASHLAMRGASLKVIQELLGHAAIEMTMRYAHLSPSAHVEAVRLLDGPATGASYGRQADAKPDKG